MRSSQPKKVRSEADVRAIVARAAPRRESTPSQARRSARVMAAGPVVVDPGLVEEHADVPHVGTHGVGRSAPFDAQVALERGERVGTDDGHAHTVSAHRPARNDTPEMLTR